MGGTSRISREAYVRFCERLGVQSPGPTRRQQQGRTTEAGLAIKELLRVLDSQAALRREQRGMFDSLENRVLQNRRAAFRNCGGVRNDGKEVNDGEARAALSTRQ